MTIILGAGPPSSSSAVWSPAYTFPANSQDFAVLRIVCRKGFTPDLAGRSFDDLEASIRELSRQPGLRTPPDAATAFYH